MAVMVFNYIDRAFENRKIWSTPSLFFSNLLKILLHTRGKGYFMQEEFYSEEFLMDRRNFPGRGCLFPEIIWKTIRS